MDKPDKIWASPGSYPTFSEDDWTNASASADVEFGSAYLLASPERELAPELVEALREIVTCGQMTFAGDAADPLSVEMVTIARAVLAKLEGKG